jgi:hypothetical protein
MTKTDIGRQQLQTIREFLAKNDWIDEGESQWIEASRENDNGVLRLEFDEASPGSVGFELIAPEREAYLSVQFDDCRSLLRVLRTFQEDLGERTWRAFIEALLASSSGLARVEGMEGDELIDIATAEEGMQALKRVRRGDATRQDYFGEEEGTDTN